jgi:5-methylcytosine-specific restriction endonuclease McrA
MTTNSKEYQRQWYYKNSEKQIAAVEVHRKRKRVFLHEVLLSNSCSECGEDSIECLDFDHVGEKTVPISVAVGNNWSIDKILSEMQKCDLLCSNCHRKRTARQGEWYRY